MKFFGLIIIFCLAIVSLSAPNGHAMLREKRSYGYYNNYYPNYGHSKPCHLNRGDYLNVYPGNPRLYVQCTNTGAYFVRSCGPGTVFNPRIGVCDYPSSIYG